MTLAIEPLESRDCPAPLQTLSPIRLREGVIRVWSEPSLAEATAQAIAVWNPLLSGPQGTQLVQACRPGRAAIKVGRFDLGEGVAGKAFHRFDRDVTEIRGGCILVHPETRTSVTAVVMHELGHLVGLGHSVNRESIMHTPHVGGGITVEEWRDTRLYRRRLNRG